MFCKSAREVLSESRLMAFLKPRFCHQTLCCAGNSGCSALALRSASFCTLRSSAQDLWKRSAAAQGDAQAVYLTWGTSQSKCRYFSRRNRRFLPSSLCKRAAVALHQTRSTCSQTRSVCSACLPRSPPSSTRAASARTAIVHADENCFYLSVS